MSRGQGPPGAKGQVGHRLKLQCCWSSLMLPNILPNIVYNVVSDRRVVHLNKFNRRTLLEGGLDFYYYVIVQYYCCGAFPRGQSVRDTDSTTER